MKVLVTGGTGTVGRWVVRALLSRGHEVTVSGRRPDMAVENARYVVADCTDLDAMLATVEGHDTVIHLAGIAGPWRQGGPAVFRANCQGTFNVFEACVRHGIRRVAVASSINALGQKFGVKPLPVRYFPVDEEHPQLCTDCYSFSKKVLEEIGEYYWERDGISSVSIRIPFVAPPGERAAAYLHRARQDPMGTELARDYWCWIDARDSARVFTAGIEAEYEGAHVLFANDRVNCIGIPSRELAAQRYPEATEWREPIDGDQALITCRKAKELLGWEPIYCWRGVADGGPIP